MDFQNYISRHIKWSKKVFGEGDRTVGLLEHIREELGEVNDSYRQFVVLSLNKKTKIQDLLDAKKKVLIEIIDIIILCIDMAWRLGFSQNEIEETLAVKQVINIKRDWPKVTSPDKPTKHIKENEK